MRQYFRFYGGGEGAFEAPPPPGPGTPKKSRRNRVEYQRWRPLVTVMLN